MPKIVRLGDGATHPGVVSSASSDYMAEGQFVARVGDVFNCGTHGPNLIVGGSTRHLNNGKGVARQGDLTACGASLIATAQTEVD